MSPTYRVVHFAPDPARPYRFPVAALLKQGPAVTVVSPDTLPGPAELGSVSGAATLELVVDTVEPAQRWQFSQLVRRRDPRPSSPEMAA
jgi:hypothetical protein